MLQEIRKKLRTRSSEYPITVISAAEEKGVSIIFLKNISGA